MLETYIDEIDKHIRFAHQVKPVFTMNFHLHQGCEIYFLIRGDVNYFVDKSIYSLQYGDLIITNEHEIHKPAFSTDALYERITMEFTPALARMFHTANFQPSACFYNRPNGRKNRVKLTSKEVTQITALFMKYDRLMKSPHEGDAILKLGCFMEILVLIHRAFSDQRVTEGGQDLPHKLAPVLEYIESNLEEDLSLVNLERKFFLNRYYLNRLFKRHTGSTIHEYIIYKRIARAKQFLANGYNVTEACQRSGFNDYTGFLRMFKKKVGILPKDYTKLTLR
ncbi:helix-turn-helix domain-containing protein [Paenibacillus gansuensis]|uniref:Helix-turn-helix domain-containing protein n=1 Tax=Paenibacillus gansuensis TaxID=306542 RepID=A0ABW5PB08_9BACL